MSKIFNTDKQDFKNKVEKIEDELLELIKEILWDYGSENDLTDFESEIYDYLDEAHYTLRTARETLIESMHDNKEIEL